MLAEVTQLRLLVERFLAQFQLRSDSLLRRRREHEFKSNTHYTELLRIKLHSFCLSLIFVCFVNLFHIWWLKITKVVAGLGNKL